MTTISNVFNRNVSSSDLASINKIDGLSVSGLTGVSNSLAYRVHEIERHLHSSGRWFGAAVTPTATRFADRIGISTGKPEAFSIDAGNDTWAIGFNCLEAMIHLLMLEKYILIHMK